MSEQIGTTLFFYDGAAASRLDSQRRWDSFIQSIDKMRWFRPNWDGPGTEGPTHTLVDSAIELAVRLRDKHYPPPFRVSPGADGTVVMEWQTGGTYQQLEVSRPFVAELYSAPPGGPSTFTEIPFGCISPGSQFVFPSELNRSSVNNRIKELV